MTLLQPGIEIISSQDNSCGTLGMILTDGNGKLFLLSALHLITNANRDSDLVVKNKVVARYIAGTSYSSSELDAMAVEIIRDKSIHVSNRIRGKDSIIRQWAIELPNNRLFTVGGVTGETACWLERYYDEYPSMGLRYVALMNNHNATQYCAQGDSGTIWCTKDGYAVSMHSQGDLPNNKAISIRVKEILEEFKLSIYKYPASLGR